MVFDCRNLGGFLYKPRQLGIRGLSTFLAKIDVARALDLIDDAIYKDLRALNDIRNAFAHATDQLHFDSPKLVRHFQKLSGWTKTADPRKLFHDRANAGTPSIPYVHLP